MDKIIKYLSWTATLMAVMMYVSYIPQITNNLNGIKGNPIQPLVAAINCTLWVAYGWLRKPKDYPLSIANLPGIFFGMIAFFTAL